MLAPVGGYGGFNTSVHRLEALRALGFEVTVVDSAMDAAPRTGQRLAALSSRLFRQGLPVPVADPACDRSRLLAAADGGWDVLWLEKALTIDRDTLRAWRARAPRAAVLGFSPDDMHARHNPSRQFLGALPEYDAFLTTKTYNVAELGALGARRVVAVGNGFDPAAFRPLPVDAAARERLGGPIGFIGTFEAERAEAMLGLARAGLPVRVWGNGWAAMAGRHPLLRIEGRALHGDDFALACGAFDVNLGFLRKLNRDQQTTRSVEVPACGGLLLAERTDEHLSLFVEDEEAAFFGDRQELEAQCRRFLGDPALRTRVAAAGRRRCEEGGYSNAERLAVALAAALDGAAPALEAATVAA
jgi:hypothetical protein